MTNFRFSIFNFQKEQGFTLVEMLAVMVVFIVIGTLIIAIMVTTFRTSNKTDVLTLVKQNGNYAITQMAKTIRDARSLVSPYPCYPSAQSTSISIITPDNNAITYSCINNTIASNGASLLDTSAVSVASCTFTCVQQSQTDLPFIDISFSLTQKNASTLAEKQASISAVPFETSVVIRNINR